MIYVSDKACTMYNVQCTLLYLFLTIVLSHCFILHLSNFLTKIERVFKFTFFLDSHSLHEI